MATAASSVTAVGQGFQAGNGGRRMGGGDGGLLRFERCGLGGERAGQQQAGEKRLVGHELVPVLGRCIA